MEADQVGGQFEAFFETYPGAFVIVTASGEIVAANASARSMGGEELVPGANLEAQAHPEERAAIAAAFAALAEDGARARFTCRLCGPKGDGRPVEWRLWRAKGRADIFATLAPADAAKAPDSRVEAMWESAMGPPVLRAILDHLDITAWATDKDGLYTFHDGKALLSAGITPGQFLGQSVFEVFRGYITPAMETAVAGTYAHETVKAAGVHWENHYLPIRDAHGAPAGVIGVSQNMNEFQKIREELESRIALIERQQSVIRDLETPTIQVWDRVLTLPMIGVVDSRRAARVMDDLLAAVTRTSARFAILDLTGVEIVDTQTAAYLVQLIRAIRLLGAEGILTGIRPTVAQTVISLGVDLSAIPTHASLRNGLAYCIRKLEGESKKRAPEAATFRR